MLYVYMGKHDTLRAVLYTTVVSSNKNMILTKVSFIPETIELRRLNYDMTMMIYK